MRQTTLLLLQLHMHDTSQHLYLGTIQLHGQRLTDLLALLGVPLSNTE